MNQKTLPLTTHLHILPGCTSQTLLIADKGELAFFFPSSIITIILLLLILSSPVFESQARPYFSLPLHYNLLCHKSNGRHAATVKSCEGAAHKYTTRGRTQSDVTQASIVAARLLIDVAHVSTYPSITCLTILYHKGDDCYWLSVKTVSEDCQHSAEVRHSDGSLAHSKNRFYTIKVESPAEQNTSTGRRGGRS